ncbi:LysR family transcriptional regulator [Amycolatopsis sp. lyj-109]|uniref:LysR family transcriptional regulator n=1 Tax=Amycolatopsis sp. lyj-109 TaxID=2789287 RepID=UPI00397B8A82
MELRQLAVVVAVAEEGGFTAAAQRLRTVQSTVSTVVRALERDLGTPLFHRTTHRVVLTPAGEAFVPAARAALEAAERARAAVSPLSGRVRLGVCPGLLADLHRVLARLRHAHPGLVLEIRQLRPEEVRCGLTESTVDVVLAAAAGVPADSGGTPAKPADLAGIHATAPDDPSAPSATLLPAATPGDPATPHAILLPAAASGDPATRNSATLLPAAPPGDPAAPNAPRLPATAGDPTALSTTLLPAEELVLATAHGGSRSAPAAPAAPADLAALADLPLVDFPPGWAIREAVDRAFPHRRISLEVDDLAVAAGLVRAGFAGCVLPTSAAGRFPELTVRRFARPVPWQLAAVHRAGAGAAVAAVLAQLG